MAKIMIIEDDLDQQKLIRVSLGPDHTYKIQNSADDIVSLAMEFKPDLFIVDVGLPGKSGIEACVQLQRNQETSAIPFIFLTAKTSTADIVLGFSAGADDYINKPFDPLELKARVEGKLKRKKHHEEAAVKLNVGTLRLDLNAQRVTDTADGKETVIPLTSLEFKILYFLAKNEGHVFTRNQILDYVWGNNALGVSDRSVDTHLSTIRKKCISISDYIESVYGEGYRFDSRISKSHNIKAN